jgi:hypothetical protein
MAEAAARAADAVRLAQDVASSAQQRAAGASQFVDAAAAAAQRAVEAQQAAAAMQERAAAAAEAAAGAQASSLRAQERAAAAQERASRSSDAAQAAVVSQARAIEAADRAKALQERATATAEAAARAQENAIQAQQRAVAAQDRAARSGEAVETASTAQERAVQAEQRARELQERADAAAQNAARAQENVAQAQAHLAAAQERASRVTANAANMEERAATAQERAGAAPDRASALADAAAAAQERATQVQERSANAQASALAVSEAAARTQERGIQAQERTAALQDRQVAVAEAAAQAQERASSSQERASQIGERASVVSEAATRVQARADGAEERAQGARDRASSLASAAELARQRAAEAQLRAAELAAAEVEADENTQLAAADQAESQGGVEKTLTERFVELVRTYPSALELLNGFAAVRHQVVAVNPSAEALEAARLNGYGIIEDETLEYIGARFVTLQIPSGKPLQVALAELERTVPGTEFSANFINLQTASVPQDGGRGTLAASVRIDGPAIGIVDGGVARTGLLPTIAQRGFAKGGLAPSTHGTAVASLVAATSRVRSSSPGAPLLVADIYGRDPLGGNSMALARALNWMAERRAPIVVLALVGPANPLVEKAIRRLQREGTMIVAAVGNAGPAAAPLFPAAYSGVIGVTGVDPENHALLEAGRGPHVMFSAPGSDLVAPNSLGELVRVRGTSFAAPLVAGKLWSARTAPGDPRRVLAQQALDLGAPGRDPVFGEGLLCADCR